MKLSVVAQGLPEHMSPPLISCPPPITIVLCFIFFTMYVVSVVVIILRLFSFV
jgi:hypothetical protein